LRYAPTVSSPSVFRYLASASSPPSPTRRSSDLSYRAYRLRSLLRRHLRNCPPDHQPGLHRYGKPQQVGACPLYHSADLLGGASLDRKSTRLNSSHVQISYAVFCLIKDKREAIPP